MAAVADEDALEDCCGQEAVFAGLGCGAYGVHGIREGDLPKNVATSGDLPEREDGGEGLLCVSYESD